MAEEWESAAPWDTLTDTLAQIFVCVDKGEPFFLLLPVRNLGFWVECSHSVCVMAQSG